MGSPLPEAYRPFAAVPCSVDIVLGTGEITIGTCMGLQKGSIVPLVEVAGQDLQLVVNGLPFGRGEVVIMDEGVSIRITELVRPDEESR